MPGQSQLLRNNTKSFEKADVGRAEPCRPAGPSSAFFAIFPARAGWKGWDEVSVFEGEWSGDRICREVRR